MLERSQTFFKGYDKSRLYFQTWHNPAAETTILITHGQAEHSDCYDRLIQGLSQHGNFNFAAWDLRGHGRSDGRRGYADQFDDYVMDHELFYDECLKISWIKKTNLILLGHSMGGLIQTCALNQSKYSEIKAQILSSPLFDLSIPVPAWKAMSAELLKSIAPAVTLGNEITFEQLTRDPEVIKEYQKDTYRHKKISPGVFLGFKEKFDKVISLAENITLPTFMCVSDNDLVISTAKALDFFKHLASESKDLKIVPDGKHELFNDLGRDHLFPSVAQFCLNQSK